LALLSAPAISYQFQLDFADFQWIFFRAAVSLSVRRGAATLSLRLFAARKNLSLEICKI